jgi:hypothetical protein
VVRGLEKFRDWFADFEDCYVLIGGAASDLVMREAGLEFRATRDLDIVLCAEALGDDFVGAFWQFVEAGGYRTRQRSGGSREYFRLQEPTSNEFPAMIELFSRELQAIPLPENARLTPIPTNSDLASLSAILMDDAYYAWVMAGRSTVEGARIVGAEKLIPLKARAFLDLAKRRANGGDVDERNVKKHKYDVVRLLQTLDRERIPDVPQVILEDVGSFVSVLRSDGLDVKNLRVAFGSVDDVVEMLELVYAPGVPRG